MGGADRPFLAGNKSLASPALYSALCGAERKMVGSVAGIVEVLVTAAE